MHKSIFELIAGSLSADKQGQWDEAHAIISQLKEPLAYEVHAYLHRKEGDADNALFWYGRAGVQPFEGAYSEEYRFLEQKLHDYIEPIHS
ncbi:TPA: hypothetical protein ACWM1T_001775 [Legionella pneumophila]|nr:hypothetical protein [Legionella pneumophila]